MSFYYVKYNDVDLSEIIRVRTVDTTVLPPRENNSISIWERQGSIYNDFKYGERKITVNFLMIATKEECMMNPDALYYKINDLKTVFNVDSPKALYLGDLYKYIYAVPEGEFKLSELRYDCCECEITFICYDPMYYSSEIKEYDNYVNTNFIKVHNGGNTITYPIINIGINSDNVSFIQLENTANRNKLLIGSYPSASKPETIKAGTVVLKDNMESTTGWGTETTFIDSNRDCNGTLATTSDGSGLMIGSHGGGSSTWQGVSARKSLERELTNFSVKVRMSHNSTGINGDPSRPYRDDPEDVITGTQTVYYVVTASALNVRTGPMETILGTLKRGTKVYPISISNGWAKINFNGRTGYCYTAYLRKMISDSTTTTTVMNVMTNKKAQLRSAPSDERDEEVKSTLLATIPSGVPLRVETEILNGFYKLYTSYNNKIGYVEADKVTSYNDIIVDYAEKDVVITADDKTGICELYGWTADGIKLFKLSLSDDNQFYEYTQPIISVGNKTILEDAISVPDPKQADSYSGNDEKLTITYDYLLSGRLGDWNEFYGELGIQRKDGKWMAWIYKIDEGSTVKKLTFKEQAITGSPTGDLAYITMYMGTQDEKKASAMSISDIEVKILNDVNPETQNVAKFSLGDTLQIDCYNNRVLYNNQLFYDIDIGSKFIELLSGSNTIKIVSDDKNIVASILFNERYL